MFVICINNNTNGQTLPLTLGKMYEVIKTVTIPFSKLRYDDPSGPYFLIKCDNGEIKHTDSSNFRELTLQEKRNLNIDKLLL